LLVIGPPGTAKSEAVRRIAAALGGTTFEYLLGRFTEPSEIFGPVDLRRLRVPRRGVPRVDGDPEHPAGNPQRTYVPAGAYLDSCAAAGVRRRIQRAP